MSHGPGRYSIAAAGLVGSKGKVYAADINNEAIDYIRKAMKFNSNIEPIQTNCNTNLSDKSIDIIFLYDIYHGLEQPEHINEGTPSRAKK